MAKDPPPVSLAVTACNEQARLASCLHSADGLVREIIVVDSGSTDGTVALAESAGARVIHQEWLGHSAQKQVALDACTQSWVLILDADEQVSEALVESIRGFFESGDSEWYHGCRFNRRIRFLGRWITHGDWYPDTKLRLVRRDKARMGGNAAHDTVLVEGAVKHLRGDLLHDSYPTIRSYLDKIIPFADEFTDRALPRGAAGHSLRTSCAPSGASSGPTSSASGFSTASRDSGSPSPPPSPSSSATAGPMRKRSGRRSSEGSKASTEGRFFFFIIRPS